MEQEQRGMLAQPGGCLSAEWVTWFESPRAAGGELRGDDLQERWGACQWTQEGPELNVPSTHPVHHSHFISGNRPLGPQRAVCMSFPATDTPADLSAFGVRVLLHSRDELGRVLPLQLLGRVEEGLESTLL